MKIGTKSILFGVHCWCIHPWWVALAWWRLYGFPWDYRLWVSFFVHDLGYWGKPNMDGPEGETHPELGAKIASFVCDPKCGLLSSKRWYRFCLYHSRFLAANHGQPFSRLCVADKYAFCLEPWWFYKPRAILSGELSEYMSPSLTKHNGEGRSIESFIAWHTSVRVYLEAWVAKNKDIPEPL